MKRYKILLAGGFLATSLLAGAQQIDPITRAVIESYTEMIGQNPKDYMSYFQRGEEYFKLGEYEKAEADILNAIKNTPSKDASFIEKEYSLLSDLYLGQNNPEKAIEVLQEGLKAAPSSYYNRYKLGNLYLALDKPQDAYNTFRILQSMNSRSQEAYYGMGLAAAALGRYPEVDDLIEQVKNANLNSYLTYQRIGDLYEAMNKNDKAAANYIQAYSMTENSSTPLESLVKLAAKDYNNVAAELDKLISAVPANASLRFIKASIAFNNGKYDIAAQDCRDLLKLKDGQEPFVYSLLAQSELNSGNADAALEAIKQAESLAPEDADIQAVKETIMNQLPSSGE